MIWLYLAGMGLNGIGFQWFVRKIGPLDNTPALRGLQISSGAGGILLFTAGFFIFPWWAPLAGLILAPFAAGMILSATPLKAFPQIAIVAGLVLSFIALLTA